MLEGVDAVERAEHGGLVLVKRQQRAQTSRIQSIDADRRDGVKAVRLLTRDQRLGLRFGNQHAVQIGVTMSELFEPQQIDRSRARAFAQPLIKRVLRLVTVSAPDHLARRPFDERAVGGRQKT